MAAATATLTAKITLNIILGGETYNIEATKKITAITNVIKQRVSVVTGSEINLITVAATAAGATLTDLDFIFIQNLDTVNKCRVRYKDTGDNTVDFDLLAEDFHIFFNNTINVSETAGAFSSFTDYDSVLAQADTAEVELLVFAGEL